jgi:hypothetical protein
MPALTHRKQPGFSNPHLTRLLLQSLQARDFPATPTIVKIETPVVPSELEELTFVLVVIKNLYALQVA